MHKNPIIRIIIKVDVTLNCKIGYDVDEATIKINFIKSCNQYFNSMADTLFIIWQNIMSI